MSCTRDVNVRAFVKIIFKANKDAYTPPSCIFDLEHDEYMRAERQIKKRKYFTPLQMHNTILILYQFFPYDTKTESRISFCISQFIPYYMTWYSYEHVMPCTRNIHRKDDKLYSCHGFEHFENYPVYKKCITYHVPDILPQSKLCSCPGFEHFKNYYINVYFINQYLNFKFK